MSPQVAAAIPVVLLASSFGAAIVVFALPEPASRARSTVNLTAASLKVVLVAALFPLVFAGDHPEWRSPLVPGVDLVLRIDSLSLLFAGLSVVLWLLTTIYAIGYLEGRPNRSRFFGFFSLCVTSTVGISFAGNLVTFLLFYEMLTLVTYPLIAHSGTTAALKSARLYLIYGVAGGLALLFGTVWLTVAVGPVEFTAGGARAVAELAADRPGTAIAIFALLVGGLAVKAALFPLHGWLPRAMVAPAPVSALLHAVAVVKAGAFGLVRVIDDVYGVEVALALGVLTPVVVLACVTILYGSLRALFQSDLKKRLAYSTVSQVSYITLGLSMASVSGTAGGLVHLVHQGLMKITLFFCAGLFAEVTGVKTVRGLAGMGRRMPLTCLAFTIGAFGMIGLPPLAGFVSKWQLGIGALDAATPQVLAVLASSALLNAAYFLPICHAMWFSDPPEANDEPDTPHGARGGRGEAPRSLLVPTLTTAGLAVLTGVAAVLPYSPLELATYIAERSYLP